MVMRLLGVDVGVLLLPYLLSLTLVYLMLLADDGELVELSLIEDVLDAFSGVVATNIVHV